MNMWMTEQLNSSLEILNFTRVLAIYKFKL